MSTSQYWSICSQAQMCLQKDKSIFTMSILILKLYFSNFSNVYLTNTFIQSSIAENLL